MNTRENKNGERPAIQFDHLLSTTSLSNTSVAERTLFRHSSAAQFNFILSIAQKKYFKNPRYLWLQLVTSLICLGDFPQFVWGNKCEIVKSSSCDADRPGNSVMRAVEWQFFLSNTGLLYSEAACLFIASWSNKHAAGEKKEILPSLFFHNIFHALCGWVW